MLDLQIPSPGQLHSLTLRPYQFDTAAIGYSGTGSAPARPSSPSAKRDGRMNSAPVTQIWRVAHVFEVPAIS